MPAGGELAALFAKRAKVGDENDTTIDASEDAAKEEKVAVAPPTPAGRLPPRSSPPSTPLTRPPISKATPPKPPTPSSHAPSSPSPAALTTEEPVKVKTPMQNEELKAKFEERNLEAGIPTPSFLTNVRKNLKKPGEKRPSTPSAEAKGYSSDSDVMNKVNKDNAIDNDTAAKTAGSDVVKSDTIKKSTVSAASKIVNNVGSKTDLDIKGGRNKTNNTKKNQATTNLQTSSTCSTDNGVQVDEKSSASGGASSSKNIVQRASSESSSHHDTLAARRSRMVAARGVSSSTETASQGGGKGSQQKFSPAKLRRDKLLARVRSNNAKSVNTTAETDSTSNVSFDASKTSIISPKRDEFEVLFADDDISPNPYITHGPHNESIDSIGNEINGSTGGGSTATMPTNNIQPRVKISMTKSTKQSDQNITPEKSRLHNAATPKIRGNGNYRREHYEEEGSDIVVPSALDVSAMSTNVAVHSSPMKQHQKSLPSFQEQQMMMVDTDDCGASTPRRHSQQPHDFSQAYPMRQSPSQLSQMSGITTPSCFPQDYSAPMGHIQQPMLIGGPIHETLSFNSSQFDNNVGLGTPRSGRGGLSAFSSGVGDAENRRLREQLSLMKKKLEEKDAIISQLMKRIGDLELNNSTTTKQTHHVNTSFNMEQSNPHGGLATPSSASTSLLSGRSAGNGSETYEMRSLWDQSQPATTSSQSSSAFQPPSLSKQRSNSMDTESACLSIPSSSQISREQSSSSHKPSSSLQKQAQQQRGRSGSMKASPITTATSSTASVTTANSSKSGKRTTPRSRSVTDTNRRSSHRRSGSGASGSQKLKKKTNDERKFVC